MLKMTQIAICSATIIGASFVSAEQLKFMSGSAGGSWFPMAGAIQAAVENQNEDIKLQVLPGNSIQNVMGVAKAKVQLGLANSVTTVDALTGKGSFEGKQAEGLCHIANLYPNYLQITSVKTDIDDFADLKGTSIATLKAGSTSRAVLDIMMDISGMTDKDFKKISTGSGSDNVTLIKDGHVQSSLLVTAAPSGLITEMATSRDVALLNIDDQTYEKLQEINSGFDRMTIPANTYPKQGEDIMTTGFMMHFIGRCDIPEDTVYKITKAVVENAKDLGAVNKFLLQTTPKIMGAPVNGVPTHPGAEKYYKEVGAL